MVSSPVFECKDHHLNNCKLLLTFWDVVLRSDGGLAKARVPRWQGTDWRYRKLWGRSDTKPASVLEQTLFCALRGASLLRQLVGQILPAHREKKITNFPQE